MGDDPVMRAREQVAEWKRRLAYPDRPVSQEDALSLIGLVEGMLAYVDARDAEVLGYREIARMLGVSEGTVRRYTSLMAADGLPYFPEPDATVVPDRPRWRRSTIEAWDARRRGMGRRREPPA